MKIAVISPYYSESIEQLERCRNSVLAQTIKCDHFMIADGRPQDLIDAWGVTHLKLPRNMNDFGDTPRMIGSGMAVTLGYDAIAYLDGDNWYEPHHVETLVGVQTQFGADVVTCARMLRRSPDLTPLAYCTESDGQAFCDTNCYLLGPKAFRALGAWGFKDRKLGVVGDRIVWQNLQAMGLRVAHSSQATINYVTTFACHYLQHGEVPPDHAKDILLNDAGEFELMPWKEAMAIYEARQKASAGPA